MDVLPLPVLKVDLLIWTQALRSASTNSLEFQDFQAFAGKLTVIDSVAQLLDDGQVPAHPVQPVNAQTCRGHNIEA